MSAVERPTGPQRSAFLQEACRDDSMLREEVEFLLASDECATNFIENPAVASLSDIFDEAALQEESHPKRIGPYDVLGVVGSGGMGTVYRAIRADDQYRKLVAIKLVRKGMETETIVQRFRRERQILASLEHPNIAQLLDGGTVDDGRPYFVMEYVEGTAIDRYCDQHKLSTRQRLELFRIVLGAVAHAHRNLIIHRDLKPGNILVKGDGTIKLLDFGIAKVLHADPAAQALERTATALRIMTPQYASPEQVRGDQLTTASDVYLLGVVLYELLTGHRPYRLRAGDTMEVIRALGQGEPEKPSTAVSRVIEEPGSDGGSKTALTPETVSRTRDGRPSRLRRSLAGDIDYIVLKALRKEAAERYSSADQMAEDIRRHLQGYPVLARRQTLAYRTTRFVDRHKGAVLASAVVVMTLLGSVTGMLWQGTLAQRRLAGAEQRFESAHAVLDSIWSEVDDAIPVSPQIARARQIMADTATRYLDELRRGAGDDPEIAQRVASGYRHAAVLYQRAGDLNKAAAVGKKSVEVYDGLAGKTPAYLVPLAGTLQDSAVIAGESGDLATAIVFMERSVKMREDLPATDTAAKERLTAGYDRMAALYLKAGSYPQALEASRKALIAAQESFARDARNQQNRRFLALAQQRYGEALEQTGNLPAAIENYTNAMSALQVLAAEEAGSHRVQHDLAGIHERLSLAQGKTQISSAAIDGYRKALAIRRAILTQPDQAEHRRALAVSLLGYGELLSRGNDRAAVAAANQEAAEILVASAQSDVLSRRELLEACRRMEALDPVKRVVQFARDWLVKDPSNSFPALLAGAAYLRIGELSSRNADKAGAAQNLRLAISILESMPDKSTDSRKTLGIAYGRLAQSLASEQPPKCAESRSAAQMSQTALTGMKQLPGDQKLFDEITGAVARCGQVSAAQSSRSQ